MEPKDSMHKLDYTFKKASLFMVSTMPYERRRIFVKYKKNEREVEINIYVNRSIDSNLLFVSMYCSDLNVPIYSSTLDERCETQEELQTRVDKFMLRFIKAFLIMCRGKNASEDDEPEVVEEEYYIDDVYIDRNEDDSFVVLECDNISKCFTAIEAFMKIETDESLMEIKQESIVNVDGKDSTVTFKWFISKAYVCNNYLIMMTCVHDRRDEDLGIYDIMQPIAICGTSFDDRSVSYMYFNDEQYSQEVKYYIDLISKRIEKLSLVSKEKPKITVTIIN